MHRTSVRPAPLDFLLPSSYSSTSNNGRLKDIGISHLANPAPIYLESSLIDGLRTPPADDMGTAYQQPQHSTYSERQDNTFTAATASGNGFTGAGAYPEQNVLQRTYRTSQGPASSLRNELPPTQPLYHQSTSPGPVTKVSSFVPTEESPSRKTTSNNAILPNLQIPSSINNSGGSLAEFAAQITCLFWFESTDTLHKAERLSPSSSPIQRLRDEAIPSSGFKKWVVTILSTTQVTQNVILLALLFIYRLKTINPAVKGRSGSEYRLLTVALMLGNKFLDDNTYTNKTWAEVSGISVTEIHVMEVEFLSNMRYSLLASKEQWQEWQQKLGKFWTYCDAAMKAPRLQASPNSAIMHPHLPSPPHSIQTSPPSGANRYPANSAPLNYSQTWASNSYTPQLVSPLTGMPDLSIQRTRKRSYDGDVEEPTAKRITRPSVQLPASFISDIPPIRHDAPRLPVPNLTISTSQPYMFNGSNSQAPVLPPLSGRSMSTVYPTTPTWVPQLPSLTPIGPSTQPLSANGNGHVTPRRQSPRSAAHDLLSLGSSPISANFPNHNSPSFYLQQRASPYKPVRHVNTLLYPPPSSSMHQYSANLEQMHYQPLGKRQEYRSGVAYPPYQQWPVLPQPNFHA